MSRTSTILELVGPAIEGDFFKNYYQRKPLHVTGTPQRFSNLFSWKIIADIVNASLFPHPQIKMHREGRPIQFSDPLQLEKQLREGTTLIIDNADHYHSDLAKFVDRFSYEYLTPARTNAYISFPGIQAFDFHYDTHDFFILQTSGKKTWYIHERTVESPLYYAKTHGVDPPKGDPLLTVTLSDGDVLYVPKGFWHYAVATEEPSIHLTLAFFVRTRMDVLNWLLGECREDPFFRRELPLLANNSQLAAASYESDVAQIGEKLKGVLSSPDLSQRFLEYVSAHLTHRERFSFPFNFLDADDMGKKYSEYERLPITPLVTFNDEVRISFHGRTITLDGRFANLVKNVFDGSSRNLFVNEVSVTFPEIAVDEIRSVFGVLSREGLLIPVGFRSSTPPEYGPLQHFDRTRIFCERKAY